MFSIQACLRCHQLVVSPGCMTLFDDSVPMVSVHFLSSLHQLVLSCSVGLIPPVLPY